MVMEADYAATEMAYGGGDEKTFAQFHLLPQQDAEASLQEGRPIFKEVPYVRIMIPGDKDNVVNRPVRENDKTRWPRQWEAFTRNQEQPITGTPLEAWPSMTRGQVEELKHFGIRTVENLVDMPDSQANKFMGIAALRQKARDFLDAAQGMAQVEQMREALRIRDARIEQLVEAVTEMQDALRKQEANKAETPTPAVAKAKKLAASVLDDPEDR